MSFSTHLFITGMLRSGTTLLEKLINTHHPSASVLYQPCMPLFTDVKNIFLASLGYAPVRYPLGHLFCETRYNAQDFAKFLEEYQPLQWSGLPDGLPKEITYQENFGKILPKIWSYIGCNQGSDVMGAKEVLCEEYTPYLATHGFQVIIIVRDPRDVITSMNYGEASRHVGAVRPTLYNLRNWRKSVAFALHLSRLGQAVYVRYEDLVRHPESCLRNILFWLGMSPIPLKIDISASLKNQKGEKWIGNSSFGGKNTISKTSVGKYKIFLPERLIEYIEAICYPEMVALGYQPDLTNVKLRDDFASIINNFSEPLTVNHAALPADYSTTAANTAIEKKRFELLNNNYQNLNEVMTEYFFIFGELQKIYREFF